MIFKLQNNRIIILLSIIFIIIIGFLWYKQETTNKVVPKRANYVINKIEGGRNHG